MVSGPYAIPHCVLSHFTLHTACLNTILRNIKPTKDAVFCSRTCRIATLVEHGQQHAKDLGRQNAVDLLKLLEWNEANKIKFMRISSEMFPFASHDKWGYGLEYAKAELEKVGEYAKEHGHRLTTHPGQFTQRKRSASSFNIMVNIYSIYVSGLSDCQGRHQLDPRARMYAFLPHPALTCSLPVC